MISISKGIKREVFSCIIRDESGNRIYGSPEQVDSCGIIAQFQFWTKEALGICKKPGNHAESGQGDMSLPCELDFVSGRCAECLSQEKVNSCRGKKLTSLQMIAYSA